MSLAPAQKQVKRLGTRNANFKSRPLKADPLSASPSFQLLCKLFVPTKYFRKTDKLTPKQVSTYLPVIVLHYSDLNFELHLLLATIVDKFVASWYFGKLKTSNLEFPRLVYRAMCTLLVDLTNRVTSRSNLLSLYSLFDGLVEIVDDHIQQIDRLNKDIEDHRSLNVELQDDTSITDTFLSHKHRYFQHEQQYLQQLSSRMLQLSLTNCETCPLSSQLTSTFCTVLVADTVFSKLIDKLSLPDFVLLTLLRALPLGGQRKTKRDKVSAFSFYGWYLVYSSSEEKYNFVSSPVWALANTITGFSTRKPLLAAFFQIFGKALSFPSISRVVDSLCEFSVLKHLESLGMLLERGVCDWVQKLKSLLAEDGPKNPETGAADVSGLKEQIVEKLTSSERVQVFLSRIAFADDTDSGAHAGLYSLLEIFENHKTNKLLAVRLFDALVAHIYPEL